MNVEVQVNEQHTLYSVEIYVPEDARITVGKLGEYVFPKGSYVYVGSAKKNIRSRVERHMRMDKNCHWHFDYFRPCGQIVRVLTYAGEEGECGLFERLRSQVNGSIPVRGFGSSDCRCPAHLFYVP
ncbi:GIY-YIG nuclease family protein [Aneurinibacillus terranovensis]|uniref:GIY-YIG nuclease family protein n=1 Tax=Aneurinibacillus terranovensis TaxID=278991 RepID=UPI0003F6D02C|nr:GIY-YIG nuclease family protein [Aneurinibacillus terranovensis]